MKQKKFTSLFLVLLLILISILTPVIPAADEPTNLEMESMVLNGANGFNVSWNIGLGADHTILVYKKDSSPTSVNNGYKYFYDNSITSSNFTGVFRKGLGYNENYSCRGYSGENPLSKVTRTIEDGVNLTFMDNSSHLPDPFFSVDSSSKVNGTRSININNPSISDSGIYGIRHFESSHALDVFSIHCRMDDKSGTADKTLSITPYSQDYTTTNASFYFNNYSGRTWNEADRIVDGIVSNWGAIRCTFPISAQLFDGNNCTGSNPGPISKVEMRANIGYNGNPNPNIIIRPIMPCGLDGNDHEYTATVHYNVGGAWTEWFNITNDDNAPVWSWDDIQNLDCEIENNCSGDSYICCSQVEILVSYIQGYIPYPEVAFYDNASTRIDEFYFNSYNTSEAWETNPGNMADGDFNTTYSRTSINHDVEHLNETTCQGTDFGDITKVELRTKFFGDHVAAAEHVLSRIHVRPVFSGGDGDNHTYTTTYNGWTEWFDITSDTNAPGTWSWSNITNLDCDVEFQKFYSEHRMFCYGVQIRATSFSNVTAGDNDFLDSWETDRVYNLTWSRYTGAINVTINDYLGNSSYANISTVAGSVDGFIINMGRSAARDVYLDEWNEVDCGTVSAGSSSTYNSTYPDAPTNFTITGTFSTLVPLSWDASDTWDQVLIRKNTSTYPLLPSDGDNVYFGPETSTSDVVDPATTTYYSAFGYSNETGLYSVDHAIVKHISSQLRSFFSYSPSHIKISDTVTFNDLSSGDIILWSWDFGDGHTSNGKQQSHDYTESGRYKVSLIITDAGGYEDKYTATVSISSFVDPSIPPPEEPENFEGYPISGMYDRLKVTDLPVSDNKIKVVVMDTGFTPTTYDGINMQNIEGYALSCFEDIYDDNGHGTFVLYEIMYITQNKCPNADIVSFKTFDKYGSAEPGDFLDALDAIKYLDPDIVSISAGAIGNPNDEYSRKVKELRERGVIVIAAAAGNLGPASGTILSPACSDHAIAVGAFDTKGTPSEGDDVICLWSSRGPVPDISPKPDVVAPGESIRGPWLYTERSKSGTSMSTPLIVGGTAAVVAQNKPLLDIVKAMYFLNLGVVGDAYEGALKDSCTLLGDENAWGAGVPDFGVVNDNFRNRLLLLIIIPIVIVVLIAAIAIYFYKRK